MFQCAACSSVACSATKCCVVLQGSCTRRMLQSTASCFSGRSAVARSATKYCTVLQWSFSRGTECYKVLHRASVVVHPWHGVLQSTAQYFRGRSAVAQSATKHCTVLQWSFTCGRQYYKVLQWSFSRCRQCYKVLHSASVVVQSSHIVLQKVLHSTSEVVQLLPVAS